MSIDNSPLPFKFPSISSNRDNHQYQLNYYSFSFLFLGLLVQAAMNGLTELEEIPQGFQMIVIIHCPFL